MGIELEKYLSICGTSNEEWKDRRGRISTRNLIANF